MPRLRVFRWLLPIALLVLVVVVVYELEPRDRAHTALSGEQAGRSVARGVRAIDLEGSDPRASFAAGVVEEDDQGRIHLEDISEVQLFRETLRPLSVEAARGDIRGAKGARTMLFEQEVALHDPDRELTVRIPRLEVDEAAGEARAQGEVRIEGASLRGSASSLVYGLRQQPTRLENVEFEDPADGEHLTAARAVLHDGLRDIELLDGVDWKRGVERFGGRSLRIVRGEDGRPVSARSEGPLTANLALVSGAPAELSGNAFEAAFDAAGEVERLALSGSASVRRGDQTLAADRLVARRAGPAGPWHVEADRRVTIEGPFEGAAALLRADALRAQLDETSGVSTATLTGRVSFESVATRAEAARATYSRAGAGELRLFGAPRRKARLVRERVRVAAEEITTDAQGVRLAARREVEATLLPERGARGSRGMLDTAAAVHFVAAELDATERGAVLVFAGQARGWQGERSLSAERITLEQGAERMRAEGGVAARLPRRSGAPAAGEAAFVQVVSETLDYERGRGLFRGAVRALVAEGWLESAELEIALSPEDGAVDEVRASGEVRTELREPRADGPPRLLEGHADRLVYRPQSATLWLIGDRAPATVRRVGAEGGTTTGRVLRYEMELGTLEVDSGAGAPARIRTSG